MKGRTDLAIETVAEKPPRCGRVHQHEYKVGSVTVNELEIMDLAAENEIGRKMGKYFTVDWDETVIDADVHTAVRDILISFIIQKNN